MKKTSLEFLGHMVLVVAVMLPSISAAQMGAAVERAAQRAAAQAAERTAAQRASKVAVEKSSQRAAVKTTDRVVKRWSSSLCKPSSPCPLPADKANTFVGGSYNEVILGADTVLYRTFSESKYKFGPGERFSYWSRSNDRGTQAVIDRAIPVSKNGNTAQYVSAIRVPKGTRVFDGIARGEKTGPVGGGSQVVLDGFKTSWGVKLAP